MSENSGFLFNDDDNQTNNILISPLELAKNQLYSFANSSDFQTKMQLAFGVAVDSNSFQIAWQNQDFSVIPNIEVRTVSELDGAIGGYAQATNTIYLSQDYLNQNAGNIGSIASVLLEEIGHAVDAKINIIDAPGDEGAIFSSLVQSKIFEPEQLQQLKLEDDHTTITLDGQIVQIEQAQPISRRGGVGGLTLPFQLDPLPQGQTEKSITVNYSYEHFSIPDQFEIRYGATPIFSTGGLVSNGKSGSKSFKQVSGNDQLTIKVTAPQSGTAWQFSVSTDAAEINVDGLLGDVIKIDLGKQKGNLALKSLPDASKGKLIDEKGENATPGTTYKVLYYVPKVTGAIQIYGRDRSGDLGLGQVTFDVEDQDQKSISVKVSVTDGFSTSGNNLVTFGTDKLDIYRQQQRLAYLGFPDSSGDPLNVDGQSQPGGETERATQLFNIVVNGLTLSQRGRISGQSKTLKAYINATNAPKWVNLNQIANFTFVATQRSFGANFSGDVIQNAITTVDRNQQSTGVSGRNGSGDPSSTHDGGRGVDIDTPGREIAANSIPHGQLFFSERQINGTWYVVTANNQIIIRDRDVYTAGNPNNNADLSRGLTTANLITDANRRNANRQYDGGTILPQIANLLVNNAGYNPQDAINIINAFRGQGVQEILFNDPRTWADGARFSPGHWGHIHFEVPVPAQAALLQNQRSFQLVPFNTPIIAENFRNAITFNNSSSLLNAIDLGTVAGNLNLTGIINAAKPEEYYRLVLGTPVSESEIEGDYYLTLRNFSVLLNGLSDDLDIELIRDYNEDGVRQDEEVITSSEGIGNGSESINLTSLPENIYYIRVFQKSGDTTYNLALTVPPLPVPQDNAGNTANNAENLGILDGNVTRSDFIGAVDSDDYYRFTLDKVSDFSLEINGLDQGNLFVYLGQDPNNDGLIGFDETIAISDNEGNETEAINVNGLAIGDYIIWLSRNNGNTDYSLNLSATPSVIPADKAGSTLATAFNLNTLTASTQSDFVGNVDPTDYYRFTLTNPSGVTLKLSGLSADADLELSQDKNGDGVISSDEVIQLSEETDNQDENINIAALPAGDYFVKVSQYDGDTNYSLALTPTTATGVDLQVTVTPVTTPLTLGDQVSYTVTVKNIGASNATGVTLSDNLPLESVLDVSAVASKGTRSISSNAITANIGSLNVNESATLVVSGRLIGSGSTSSLIQASSAEADFNPDNDSVVQRFNVVPGTIQPADLELSLTSDQATANIDDIVTLRITLTNKGNGAATSIKVKQVLAQGLTFVSSSPQQGSYDAVLGIWDVGNIAKDNQAFIDIVTKVTSGGSLFNTAEIIAVAETDPDSTPNNNNPNEDDQASITLNAALVTATLAKITDDIFTISGGNNKPKLQVTLSESNSNLLNELAVFTVDDAQGKINGISPGETGYTQAALNKSKVIFSTIANVPNGFNTNNLTSLLEFESGNNLRFLLVKNGTIDSVQNGNTPTSDILFSDLSRQKITDLGTDGFSLAWKDGSNNNTDFKDLVVNIKSTNDPLPLGTNLQGKQQGEVLDLRGITQDVKADFVVNREAAFNNFVGFYKVADENGGIDVDADGTVDFRPGDSGYAQAAIKNRVAGIDLRVDNQGTASFTDKTLTGGSIFAPFILTNGRTVDQVLNGQVDQAYFGYLGANADQVDHIRLLGNNVFGFEDLAGGGDKDYNDVVLRVNLSVV
jgi:uncharacterized repeat protein (TIGR01451 family)